MKKSNLLYVVAVVLLSACGSTPSDPYWELKIELKKGSIGNFYPSILGTITRKSSLATSSGTKATTKFYSDEYKTLIAKDESILGADLEVKGVKEVNITNLSSYLKPATSGKDKICVEFQTEDSNFEETKQLGCLTGTD